MSRAYLEATFKTNELKLLPLGDIHLGDQACDLELLYDTLDYIKKNDVTVIGMGDYMNCATKQSLSDSYVSSMNPQEEYDKLYDLFHPIREKFLGLLTGNHEQRIQKESGVNLTKVFCKELDAPYLGWAAFLKLNVGSDPDPRRNQSYVIRATHGASFASTPEGKMRKCRQLSESFEADLYLMGHVHSLQTSSEEKLRVDKRMKCVQRFKRHYVLTGHFLGYQDSYAEMKVMKPEGKGVPLITLSGDKYNIECDCDGDVV